MDSIHWKTDEAHFDNSETMDDYISHVNLLDIVMVDGTYAEGVNCKGEKYAIHVGGDGDSFNHVARFEFLNNQP